MQVRIKPSRYGYATLHIVNKRRAKALLAENIANGLCESALTDGAYFDSVDEVCETLSLSSRHRRDLNEGWDIVVNKVDPWLVKHCFGYCSN